MIQTHAIKGLIPAFEGMSVDICMINSRGRDNEWFKMAKESALNQVYPGNLLIFENNLKTYSIGECWNKLAKKSKANLVFFVGDDDIINPDCSIVLVLGMIIMAAMGKPAALSSCCETLIDDKGKILGHRQHTPTGMIWRQLILDRGFKENLAKQVDTEYLEYLRSQDGLTLTNSSYFGYLYRQHSGNVSKSILSVVK